MARATSSWCSPGGNPDPDPNGTKNYFYDFGTGATQDFSVHNKSTTAASNTLSVFSGRPDVVLMFDGCTGQALAPDGVCHIVVTFTAPAGCNPGDLFDTPVAVVGLTNDFPNPYPYIVLDAHGTCPTPP